MVFNAASLRVHVVNILVCPEHCHRDGAVLGFPVGHESQQHEQEQAGYQDSRPEREYANTERFRLQMPNVTRWYSLCRCIFDLSTIALAASRGWGSLLSRTRLVFLGPADCSSSVALQQQQPDQLTENPPMHILYMTAPLHTIKKATAGATYIRVFVFGRVVLMYLVPSPACIPTRSVLRCPYVLL